MELYDHQLEVIPKLSSGKVLYGVVGSGKSAAILGYYVEQEEYRDIYVITTARKRDEGDWQDEAARFGIGTDISAYGKLTVDSWNNVGKYTDIKDAFFVLDEQRLVGSGAWVKAFYKIVANGNHWILLSATPGDSWIDYAPVFIANGYFKNKRDFLMKHVVFKPYMKFPVIDFYFNEEKLEEYRNEVLVEMTYRFKDKRVLNWWDVGHDAAAFKRVHKDRWNIYEDRPITDVAEMYRLMRQVVNTDPSRMEALLELHKMHPRLIVFYNWNYELEILRELYQTHNVFEYNGHRKHMLGEFEHLDEWIYLVQYTAGAEAWNCISTDAMVMWSLNYSFKIFEQVQGRIDRMNTPFERLYYYVFVSNSWIDQQIKKALVKKETFNEKRALRDSLKELQMVEEVGDDTDAEWELEMEAKHGISDGKMLEVCEV